MNRAAYALLSVLLLVVLSLPVFAVHEPGHVEVQGEAVELTQQQFEQMNDNQKAQFFTTPQNVVKNIQFAERYFQDPSSFQRAREGAQQFLRTKYQANYVLDTTAADLRYNAPDGTLQSGTKKIMLKEYQNDPTVREIRAVRDDFIIVTADKTVTLSGTGITDINYAAGSFSIKDSGGRSHSFEPGPSATSRIAIAGDGTVVINGDATGSVKTAEGLFTFTLKTTRVNPDDPDPQLVIGANGDIDVIDGDAEVDTPALYLDGQFTKKGSDIFSYALYDPATKSTKETVLVDKATSIGVISAGQARSKGESVLTHIDHLVTGPSDNPAFTPGSALSQEEAREQAAGIRRQPNPRTPNSAVVNIKKLPSGPVVNAEGKVRIVNFHLGPDGTVPHRDAIDESKPQFVGLSDATEIHYSIDGQREFVDVSGAAEYKDQQMSVDQKTGARLQKNAALHRETKDVLTLSCSGCAAGEAFKITKYAALVTRGGERHGYDVSRAGVDIVYSFEGGKLVVDPTQVSIQSVAGQIENRNSRLAFDKQLYIKVDKQDDVFAIGGNSIAMYQSGSAPPVSVVLNAKSALGDPVVFDPSQLMFGIDPTKLGNRPYVAAVERALTRQDEADALRRQIKQQYGVDFTDSGACANKACSDKVQASLGKGDAFAKAYLQLRRSALTSESDLNNALAVAARADGKSTAFVKKSNAEIQKQLKGLAGIEANWQQQQRRAAEQAADETTRKEDTGRSISVGLQLKELDAALALKQKEFDAAQQKLKLAKTPSEAGKLGAALTYGRRIFTSDTEEQDLVEALSAVRWYEDDIKQLTSQKAKLSQEAAELVGRHEKSDPEALIAILTNVGETEQAKMLALQLAQQADAARATSSGIKEYKQMEGLRERAFLLASVACSKGGDAGCAEEQLAKISNADLKQKAAAAKHQNIDVKLADKAFYAAQGAMMDEIEKHVGFVHSRDDVPWFFTSSSKVWENADERYEDAAVQQALNKQRAAYVTADLVAQGKTLKQVYDMSHDEIRRAVGSDNIGDMTAFKAEQLRYDVALASGTGLTDQQKFDILMRKAENKVLSEHGDEKAAEEDYLQAVNEFAGKADVRPALAGLRRIDEDKELKVMISPVELLGDGFGFNTGIKLPWSSQEVGRFASEMLDVSWVLDAAPAVKIGAKLAVSSIKLRRAAELAKLGMTEAEILAKLNQPGKAVALLQRVQLGAAAVAEKVPLVLKRQRGISLTAFGRDLKTQINTAMEEVHLLERAGMVQDAHQARQALADFEKISHANDIYKSNYGGIIGSSKRAVAATAKAPVRIAEAGVQRLPKPLREFVATTAQQFSDTLASNSKTYASLRGVERGVERVGEDISTGYARVRSAAEQFKRAKASGDVGQLLAASDHLIEAEKGIHIEYFVDAFAHRKIATLVDEVHKAARAGVTTVTPELNRAAAQMLDHAGSFAANIDREVDEGRALLKCASPCELTADGRAVLEAADTSPDLVADMATQFRTPSATDVDAGLAVMDGARAAEMGADPTRVVSGAALDDLVGSVEVNPKLSGAAQARAIDDAVVSRSLPNEIAREELESMKELPEVRGYRQKLQRAEDVEIVDVSLERLRLVPYEQTDLWVDSRTGEIVAHGSFSKVKHLAEDPGLQMIRVTPSPFGGFETEVNLENFLTPRGQQVFETTMDEFARIHPPAGRTMTPRETPRAKAGVIPEHSRSPEQPRIRTEFPDDQTRLDEGIEETIHSGELDEPTTPSAPMVRQPESVPDISMPAAPAPPSRTPTARLRPAAREPEPLPIQPQPEAPAALTSPPRVAEQEPLPLQPLPSTAAPVAEQPSGPLKVPPPGWQAPGEIATPPPRKAFAQQQPPFPLKLPEGEVIVSVDDGNIRALKQAYEHAGTIDERVRLARVDIVKTEMVSGEKLFEIKGRHLGQDGKPVGTLRDGLSFDHNIIVLTDGTVDVQRRYGLNSVLDSDGSLTAKMLRSEDEQLAAVLNSLGATKYHTVPSHDLELVTLCRLHPCTIETERTKVINELVAWLDSDIGTAFLKTPEGTQWAEAHLQRGFWGGAKRLVGINTIDLDLVTTRALDYPDAFLRGKKYPVTVDISQTIVPTPSVASVASVAPGAITQPLLEVVSPSEGSLLEELVQAPVTKKVSHTNLLKRSDISDTVKDELERLGVKDILLTDLGGKTVDNGKAARLVLPGSIIDKLEDAGVSLHQPRIVELADGRKVVWKLDLSNPISGDINYRVYMPSVHDTGRRQLGMAGILDEFDNVIVPRMRRLQTVDGHGIIESQFVEGYISFGKFPRDQFAKLNKYVKEKKITQLEYNEIVRQAEEQGIINLVFGGADVELGVVRLPHADGADPSTYVRMVRFDEEQAFLGMLDYPIYSQSVPRDYLTQTISSPNDYIFGLFKKEEFLLPDGTFDVEKMRRQFTPVAQKLEQILSDKERFVVKLRNVGYRREEAEQIYSKSKKNLANILDELKTGGTGPRPLQKFIESNGKQMVTTKGLLTFDERRATTLSQQPRRARAVVDDAKHDPGVVAEFVPRERRVAEVASSSSFELPAEFRSVSPEYTASIRGKVPKAVVTKELVGGDSGGGTALVVIGRIEGVDKDVALKVATEVMVAPTNLERTIRMWNHEIEAGQELEKLLPTPHYYSIVDIDGNPTLALEQVEGIPFKFGKPVMPLSSKEYTDLVSEKSIEQLFDGLQHAEDTGWQANDIQYFILTKDQIVNGKQYHHGDVIFFDFEGWKKGTVTPGATPRNEAEALQKELKKLRGEVRSKQTTRPLTLPERRMIGFVETSGLSVDYANAWNGAKAGKDVKIKRYSDYFRGKYTGDNAYLGDAVLAEAQPEFVARADAIADEFNALSLAERQKRVDEFIGRMEEVIQGNADIVPASLPGYASRREILNDLNPFTRWLEQEHIPWAVSGSGGIADELAAIGQRTGDADILISSSTWKPLDELLQQKAAAGTLEEIGVKEYKPMHYNPASPRPGVQYETTAKGSIILKNGQEVDLLGGMGYGVTDAATIRQGFLEIAPGIRAPVELSPTGKGYRAVFFDLDEFGRPTIPAFFREGEDGVQFMTLDALHAKYAYEKRPERVAFVEGLMNAQKTVGGLVPQRAAVPVELPAIVAQKVSYGTNPATGALFVSSGPVDKVLSKNNLLAAAGTFGKQETTPLTLHVDRATGHLRLFSRTNDPAFAAGLKEGDLVSSIYVTRGGFLFGPSPTFIVKDGQFIRDFAPKELVDVLIKPKIEQYTHQWYSASRAAQDALPVTLTKNSKTGKTFVSAGPLDRVFTPQNLLDSAVPFGEDNLQSVLIHVDTDGIFRVVDASNPDIRKLTVHDGDFFMPAIIDAKGKLVGGRVPQGIKDGKLSEDVVEQGTLNALYNQRTREYTDRYFPKKAVLEVPPKLPASSFPVNIPPGAAKFGFTHLEELERLSTEGKSEQAWTYFTKFKDDILPADAQKLEPYLQTNMLIGQAKINDLEAWIDTPAGKSFLETPEGKAWYGEHKQSWFLGLFQRGKLKKGTLETAEAFPAVFIDESKYAAKPGRVLDVNTVTGKAYITGGDTHDMFTLENILATVGETDRPDRRVMSAVFDQHTGSVKILSPGTTSGFKTEDEGKIFVLIYTDVDGRIMGGQSTIIKGGGVEFMNRANIVDDPLLDRFVNPVFYEYNARYFPKNEPDIVLPKTAEVTSVPAGEKSSEAVSSARPRAMAEEIRGIDYDFLQVIKILGVTPGEAAAQEERLRRIAAAYKAEVGFRGTAPELAKLIDDGLLTPDEFEKLRSSAVVRDAAKEALGADFVAAHKVALQRITEATGITKPSMPDFAKRKVYQKLEDALRSSVDKEKSIAVFTRLAQETGYDVVNIYTYFKTPVIERRVQEIIEFSKARPRTPESEITLFRGIQDAAFDANPTLFIELAKDASLSDYTLSALFLRLTVSDVEIKIANYLPQIIHAARANGAPDYELQRLIKNAGMAIFDLEINDAVGASLVQIAHDAAPEGSKVYEDLDTFVRISLPDPDKLPIPRESLPARVAELAHKYKEGTAPLLDRFKERVFEYEKLFGDITRQNLEEFGITHSHRYFFPGDPSSISLNYHTAWSNPRILDPAKFDVSLLTENLKNLDPAYHADRPVALLIHTTHDWNGAFEDPEYIYKIKQLQAKYKLFIVEAGTDDDAFKQIERIATLHGVDAVGKPNKPISVLIIGGHGTPETLELGYSPLRDTIRTAEERALFNHEYLTVDDGDKFKAVAHDMQQDGEIVLISCSTGKGGPCAKNLATTIAENIPGVRVHAPTASTHAETFQFEDGIFKGITFKSDKNILGDDAGMTVGPMNVHARFHALLDTPAFDSDKAMDYLADAFPDVRARFAADAGVEEGQTIRQHTALVYRQFAEQVPFYDIANVPVPDGVNTEKVLRATIALHDIGKSDAVTAGTKRLQHEFTLPILDEKLQALGFNEQEVALAHALVGNDILGDLAKGTITPFDALKQLEAQAASAEMAVADFIQLQKLMYVSDASSYPRLLSKVFGRTKTGKLVPKSDSFGELERMVRLSPDERVALETGELEKTSKPFSDELERIKQGVVPPTEPSFRSLQKIGVTVLEAPDGGTRLKYGDHVIDLNDPAIQRRVINHNYVIILETKDGVDTVLARNAAGEYYLYFYTAPTAYRAPTPEAVRQMSSSLDEILTTSTEYIDVQIEEGELMRLRAKNPAAFDAALSQKYFDIPQAVSSQHHRTLVQASVQPIARQLRIPQRELENAVSTLATSVAARYVNAMPQTIVRSFENLESILSAGTISVNPVPAVRDALKGGAQSVFSFRGDPGSVVYGDVLFAFPKSRFESGAVYLPGDLPNGVQPSLQRADQAVSFGSKLSMRLNAKDADALLAEYIATDIITRRLKTGKTLEQILHEPPTSNEVLQYYVAKGLDGSAARVDNLNALGRFEGRSGSVSLDQVTLIVEASRLAEVETLLKNSGRLGTVRVIGVEGKWGRSPKGAKAAEKGSNTVRTSAFGHVAGFHPGVLEDRGNNIYVLKPALISP